MTLKGIGKTNYMWGGGSRSQVETFVLIRVAVYTHSFQFLIAHGRGGREFCGRQALPSPQMLKGSSTGPLRAGGQSRLSYK